MKEPYLYLGLLVAFFLGGFAARLVESEEDHSKCAKVELPEEYLTITPEDTLMGYYNHNSDTLHIIFGSVRSTKNLDLE